MTLLRPAILMIALMIAVFTLAACEPEVGSADWCKALDEKDQGKWTLDETGDFTKYCVLGMKPE